MYVQKRHVTVDDLEPIVAAMRLSPDDAEGVVLGVKWSDPALALYYFDDPFIVLGFVPFGEDSAYAWMQWTPETYKRPYATARMARDIFAEVKQKYRRIVGHCSYGPRPMHLLKRLGAHFRVDTDGRPVYLMEREDV